MAASKPPSAAAMQVQFKSAVQRLDVSSTVDIFDQHFDQVATGPLFWLPDLVECGLTYQMIAERHIQMESEWPGMFSSFEPY
jgi:hypothetical protein